MMRFQPALSRLGRAVLYPARHIRWKIVAPYVVLTLILAAAGTYIATHLVAGSLEERFNNQLAEAARVTSDAVVRRERQHLEVVRGIAFTKGVGDATKTGKAGQLEALVRPLAANNQSELVEVLNARGQGMLSLYLADPKSLSYQPLKDTTPRASWPVVKSVLAGETDPRGDKFAQLVQTNRGYALYTAGPIFDDAGGLAGVVLVGSLLDSFLPVAKTEALADLTVYDFDGTPLATTLATSGEEEDADLIPAPGALSGLAASGALREKKTLFGRQFDLLYGDLVIRDRSVGLYSAALPSSFIASAGGATRW